MIGFCSRCKEFRGDGNAWDILIKNGYPICEKCGASVDVIDGEDL